MADNHALVQGHPDMDYAEHERTYRMFISMAKWGAIAVACILIFMAVTLL